MPAPGTSGSARSGPSGLSSRIVRIRLKQTVGRDRSDRAMSVPRSHEAGVARPQERFGNCHNQRFLRSDQSLFAGEKRNKTRVAGLPTMRGFLARFQMPRILRSILVHVVLLAGVASVLSACVVYP